MARVDEQTVQALLQMDGREVMVDDLRPVEDVDGRPLYLEGSIEPATLVVHPALLGWSVFEDGDDDGR